MDKRSRRQACRSCDGMNSEDAKRRKEEREILLSIFAPLLFVRQLV